MLRYVRRWHDAANGPLHGEARLLWFTSIPPATPATPDPADEEEEDGAVAPPNAPAPTPAENIDVQKEVTRRRMENIMLEDVPVSGEKLEAKTIANDAQALRQRLGSSIGLLQKLKEDAEQSKNKEELQREIEELQITIGALKKRMTDSVFPLVGDGENERGLRLDEWEAGTMTPAEFLRRYTAYMGDNGTMDTIDNADRSLTPERRRERKAARMQLLADTIAEVEKAKRTLPTNLSQHVIENNVTPAVFEEELWMVIYTDDEKKGIIKAISDAAGVTILKEIVADDIDSINSRLDEHKFDATIKKLQRSILEETRKNPSGGGATEGWEGGSYINPRNIFATITSTGHTINQTLGLEWMTAYEWIEALNEVWEGVKELRKQKSRLRVSRAASTIGKALSMIPGMGGEALVAMLDQQQEAKNEEIKDAFVKELKNNRVDPGFKDLFGDEQGSQGLLAYYRQLGDTNRTRAILEFAAGKGMLYEISGKAEAAEYTLPGGIPFSSLMPSEWTTGQINTYMSNLQFMNTQGINSMIKAGEDFASGRSKFDEYTEPFDGAVNSLSLWFAKGIANKALTKVKEGEMSSMLTLIVCEAWETNALFRRYVDLEWMDRLAGDSKQLLIGMIKYDKAHLHDGAKKFNEKYIENADAKADDPEKQGQQRLGPLVAAVRSYLIDLDPSLESDDKETKARFRRLQAKLFACKRIGPKDDLRGGKYASFYSDRIMPYHIQYDPNEMRDAAVDKLGDDNFIERSEIINCTAEVMQYIGALRENGFNEPTKARYFFSQIIDAYDELNDLAKKPGPQQDEFQRAKENFLLKQRGNLNLWIERALKQNGAAALLTERHSDQKGRLLVLTLLKKNLISLDVVEKLSVEGNKHAKTLLKQLKESGGTSPVSRRGESGAGAAGSTHAIAA